MRAELPGDAVDHERLHAAEHDPELLVRVAVCRHGGPGTELDQVQHHALAEQRPALDALDQGERGDVVEVDELRLHRAEVSHRHLSGRARAIAIVTRMTALETDLLRDRAYIDGAWVGADSGATFPVIDPATGAVLADVPRMGAAETRRAIEAAQRALPAWKHRTARDRAQVLRRLADLMLDRADDLATLLVREQGKPFVEAKLEIALRGLLLRVVRRGSEAARRTRDPAAAPRPSHHRAA